MAQRAHVPKFGNWDGDREVPYTQYFDNARKGRIPGNKFNPNDPQENPEAFESLPAHDMEPPKPKHERRQSREDITHHQPFVGGTNSDARVEPQRRAGRLSAGSDRSVEQSPHHVKSGSRGGVSSASWERSDGYGQIAPNTPSRSRMRPGGRGDDNTPERGPAVPKFGAWDEGDPASAEEFTHIFEKVREEKKVGSNNVPAISNDTYYPNGHRRSNSSDSVSCCCFSLGKS